MVDIVIQLLPHILAALLYGALGFHFWNTRWREHEGQSIAAPMQAWERIAIAAALLIHGLWPLQRPVHRRRHALLVQLRAVADDVAGRPDLLAGKLHGTHGRHAAHGLAVGRHVCSVAGHLPASSPGGQRQRHRLQAAFPGRHARLQPADAIGIARDFHGLHRKRACTSA
jgi:hypothetical protein